MSELSKIKNKDKQFVSFVINSKKTIFLILVKKQISIADLEKLGAEFFDYFSHKNKKNFAVYSENLIGKNNNFIGHFLHGFKLKSYEFSLYKSKKK